jgi:hypothetical protein
VPRRDFLLHSPTLAFALSPTLAFAVSLPPFQSPFPHLQGPLTKRWQVWYVLWYWCCAQRVSSLSLLSNVRSISSKAARARARERARARDKKRQEEERECWHAARVNESKIREWMPKCRRLSGLTDIEYEDISSPCVHPRADPHIRNISLFPPI